ncbi:MAG: Crp/Fnr family transcriptional regulator [Chloroflexi bacterium]|nr:Crp/Fnr family transcriptional regulator [Chloroflexota bacterium]
MPATLQTAPVSDAVRARQTLSTVRYFADLPADVLDILVARMIPRKFDAGQVICLEGEPGEKVYILEKGWVKAVRTAVDGREQAAMFLRGGELFGDEAVFTGTVYPVTVIALENTAAWALEGQAALELVQRTPSLAMAVIRHLGERVLYYVQLVEDLGLRSVQARVAHTLLLHVELRDGQLVVPRQAWTTLDEMAARLGTVRDVLSRTLSVLESDGILRMERTKIIIFDPQKLLERGRV